MIGKALGLKTVPKTLEEILASPVSSKEMSLLKQIIERQQKGNLPFITEEGIADFPSSSLAVAKSGTGLRQEEQESETFASNMSKLPSQGFMDQKKKMLQEEEKKSMVKKESSNLSGPPDDEKISMWLPSFTNTA